MVDENYNITDIIDWSGVQTVPQEVFAAIVGFRPPMLGDRDLEYKFCLELFIKALRQREHTLADEGNWLVLSSFVGSDKAECAHKALHTGFPWCGVHYAAITPNGFGEAATWASVQKRVL